MTVVLPVGRRFRVLCQGDEGGCSGLDWTVDTEGYAVNLLAKHDREHHGLTPGHVYNITDAAAAYTVTQDVGGTVADAGAAVWEALTGLRGADAMAHAVQVLRAYHDSGSDVTAVTPPF